MGSSPLLTLGQKKKQKRMKILFRKTGKPYTYNHIKRCVANFGSGYNKTVLRVTETSENGMDKGVFFTSVAILMPNFLMTRAGPFKGVNFVDGTVKDPKGQIAACWNEVGEATVRLRARLDRERKKSRHRVLVEMPRAAREEVAFELWQLLNRLSGVCWTENSFGLVGASKVLFGALPEVALPIDNAEWRKVFKTIDYGHIITAMAEEIRAWEKRVGRKLDACDRDGGLTLPAIYNVMAMKARPLNKV